MIKWGLEEEIFVTEPERPGTESLYCLAKLLWRNPNFFYFRTASNFARGRDILQGLMSCVEISTSVCDSPSAIIEDLKQRRTDLCDVCDGLVVAMGHLINFNTPTNTAALQIHLSGMKNWEKTYANLVHFLPLLALISANAPAANKSYFGKSFRMAHSFAVGALTGNPYNRFQDVIFAKRLNTLEIRIFDPFWDLKRMEVLLNAINAIAGLDYDFTLNIETYNHLRSHFVIYGMNEELEKVYKELSCICDFPKEMVEKTPGDEVWESFERDLDLIGTYSALDNAYRNGKLKAAARFKQKSFPVRLLRKAAGFGGYYLPKLPYIIYKYLKEK